MACALAAAPAVQAGVLTYGDENCLNTNTTTSNCYTSDPEAGATLLGLAPGVSSSATGYYGHTYPFSPYPGDFPGTDQIYVGSGQTGFEDGYSQTSERTQGPDVMTMDYSSLAPAGSSILTLTLGIAADDFQYPAYGDVDPFTAKINGSVDAGVTALLNSLNESGPLVHFVTIGIPTSELLPSNILTLSINEGGNGGDGWAVDFLTVGVTTSATAVPEPATLALMAGGPALALIRRKKRA
ncbi:MAG: PEP-CTERM sorting domain-containing protein [Bryobacteraceae bacterium]